jgi:Na+:H+ antiporter, NhaA family
MSAVPEPRPVRLTVPIDTGRDHLVGPDDAPVTLLEYGDYECPDCGRAYPLLDELRRTCGDNLRFAFRHFPLFTVHRHASIAAQAAEAAAAQGKFWAMHDLLYLNQDRLELPDFTHYAVKIGLEVYRFDHALAAGTYLRRVQADFAGGTASGVRGTPTLFLNGVRYDGPVSLDALSAAIDACAESA